MAASIASNTVQGVTIVVILALDNGTAPGFVFPLTPPDGRSAGQWQTDCGNAALAIANGPAPGDGGPDASVATASLAQTG